MPRSGMSANILLMEEILHQLIGRISLLLQGFVHPRWCLPDFWTINIIEWPIRTWCGGRDYQSSSLFRKKGSLSQMAKIRFLGGTGELEHPRLPVAGWFFVSLHRFGNVVRLLKWVFPKIGVPPNHPLKNWDFLYKPSILGYPMDHQHWCFAHPYFWKHPNTNFISPRLSNLPTVL